MNAVDSIGHLVKVQLFSAIGLKEKKNEKEKGE